MPCETHYVGDDDEVMVEDLEANGEAPRTPVAKRNQAEEASAASPAKTMRARHSAVPLQSPIQFLTAVPLHRRSPCSRRTATCFNTCR